MRPHVNRIVSLATAILFLAASVARGQGSDASLATQIAQATQNPLSGLLNIPLNFNFVSGGELADRTSYTLLVEPLIPLSVGTGWNVIARPIVPYSSIPSDTRRSGGLGDIRLETFISPAQISEFMWGLGPAFSFPTATDDVSRTGAWGLGPAAIVTRQSGAFVIGGQLTHLWTIADYENERPNISQLTLQPFVNYNFADGWALSFAPLMTGNWTAPDGDQITIPLGLGFSKITFIGRQPLGVGAEYYHNVVRPRGSGTAHLKLNVSFPFPAAS